MVEVTAQSEGLVNATSTSLPADMCSGIVVDGAHQAMAVSPIYSRLNISSGTRKEAV
jgi:hypothetical protein